KVFAYFSINEKELLDFSKSQENTTQKDKLETVQDASLQLANGTTYSQKGQITTNFGDINTQTGSANFRATFPNPNGLIRSGSSANILIPIPVYSTILIPQDATFDLQGKKFVYRLIKKDSLVSTGIEVSENTI